MIRTTFFSAIFAALASQGYSINLESTPQTWSQIEASSPALEMFLAQQENKTVATPETKTNSYKEKAEKDKADKEKAEKEKAEKAAKTAQEGEKKKKEQQEALVKK